MTEQSINPERLELTGKPSGPAAAAVIAAGLGVLCLGVLTTLSEASTGVHDWLDFKSRVGPLSGKTTVTVVVWLAFWLALSMQLWRRNVTYGLMTIVAAGCIALGIIGTFPKFFELFAD